MSRLALVTGGTRGIGAAIAVTLKTRGFQVVASYCGNVDAAENFSKANTIPVYRWDVGDYEACKVGLAAIEAVHGPIEVLVNNAGITRDKVLHRMAVEDWHAVIRTNLDSLFFMTQPLLSGMRKRGFGRIINISSINGQKGQFGQANYAAAKAGVIGFTKSLALENAAKGITVNAIAPGYVGTEMVQKIPSEVLESQILPHIPLGRLGTPEEIAESVAFLAGDHAGFVTGATLSINGGQLMS